MREKHDAFTKKDVRKINNLQKFNSRLNKFIDKLNKKHNHLPSDRRDSYILYPIIDSLEILNDLISRLTFSLPKKEKAYVKFIVSNKLFKNIKQKDYKNHFLFLEEHELSKELSNNYILIHDIKSLNKLSVLRYAHKIEIIDKNFFSDVEAENLRKLYYLSLDNHNKLHYENISFRNFDKMLQRYKSKKTAYCFTSGPSFDEYRTIEYEKNSLNIICNSTIRNKKFLKHIKNIDIVTFADPVFHFGPSDYAKQFRFDLMKIVKKYNPYVIIPNQFVPLMLAHYPELAKNIIGIKLSHNYNFPSPERFYTKGTANILTLFMVPIASTISDNIFIIGADGREPSEKYFWKHNSQAQYDDKMESAFIAHPSFFRDRIYTDYYLNHVKTLDAMIHYGENKGKLYGSLTKSFIKPLKKRYINKKIPLKLRIPHLKSKIIVNEKQSEIPFNQFDFSIKMNKFFTHIDNLKRNYNKIAIYGNGVIGKLLAKELSDNLNFIVDKDKNSTSSYTKIISPDKINEEEFDILVISVLGREEEVIETLNIPEDKLYFLNVTSPSKSFSIIPSEKLIGTYSRNSKMTIDETKVILDYLDYDKGVMFDVGAHFGYSSFDFLTNDWKVYAYEADKYNKQILENTVKNFENIKISPYAISNKNNKLLDFYSSDESTGVSGLNPFTDNHKTNTKVKTSTLDNEIKKYNIKEIDFLKIDTEGHDLFVLKGLNFNKVSPKIIECEFENKKTVDLGYTSNDLADYLLNHGYSVYVSEWHPIIRYGISHQWKQFYKYESQDIDPNSWGNFLAFKDKVNEKKLTKIFRQHLFKTYY